MLLRIPCSPPEAIPRKSRAYEGFLVPFSGHEALLPAARRWAAGVQFRKCGSGWADAGQTDKGELA